MYKKKYYGLNCEVHPKMAYILPDYIAMLQIIISAYLCLHFTFCCAFVQVHSWQRKFQCYLFVGFLSSVSTVSDQNWSAEEGLMQQKKKLMLSVIRACGNIGRDIESRKK